MKVRKEEVETDAAADGGLAVPGSSCGYSDEDMNGEEYAGGGGGGGIGGAVGTTEEYSCVWNRLVRDVNDWRDGNEATEQDKEVKKKKKKRRERHGTVSGRLANDDDEEPPPADPRVGSGGKKSTGESENMPGEGRWYESAPLLLAKYGPNPYATTTTTTTPTVNI